jgi:hypothetical protein
MKMKATHKEFTSSFYGLKAILTKSLPDEYRIAEYDSHLGHYCGSHTYETEAAALQWLENARFFPSSWNAAASL